MKAKPILAIFIVMLLMAVAVPFITSADTTQYWYQSDASATGSGADYIMYKDSKVGAATDITISEEGSLVWTADEAAECAVAFPGGSWSYKVYAAATSSAEEIFLQVGYWDGTTFHPATGGAVFTVTANEYSSGNFTVNPFDVPDTKWLAYKITNLTGSGDFKIVVNHDDSRIGSPTTDPGYPIPELPTIILLATGLVGLAGYFGLKRRKRAYVRA